MPKAVVKVDRVKPARGNFDVFYTVHADSGLRFASSVELNWTDLPAVQLTAIRNAVVEQTSRLGLVGLLTSDIVIYGAPG